ncbi:MAG: phospholipase D-like domain-containing protein, partial [Flavobacteriales bacterium]|nr:phospholipase D-like domain-containing protein [Flavobacteriales bacterium]
GAIEDVNSTGSEYDALLDAGIAFYSHTGISGQLHHKYGIIDQSEPLSDPTVVTGSHNWSTTAETTNDENTVIVHDARVANLYFQEFSGLLNAMGVGIHEAGEDQPLCHVFPNPATSTITIQLTELASMGDWIRLLDGQGRLVLTEQIMGTSTRLEIGHLSAGIYLMQYGNSQPSQLVIQ